MQRAVPRLRVGRCTSAPLDP